MKSRVRTVHITYIERKKISRSLPSANVTRYAMPESVDNALLSTMIAAAPVYARPTSAPMLSANRRPAA